MICLPNTFFLFIDVKPLGHFVLSVIKNRINSTISFEFFGSNELFFWRIGIKFESSCFLTTFKRAFIFKMIGLWIITYPNTFALSLCVGFVDVLCVNCRRCRQ